jgi:hypothetical protein
LGCQNKKEEKEKKKKLADARAGLPKFGSRIA